MARYTIITLVDITRTQPTRSETDKIKLGQQSNFAKGYFFKILLIAST